MTDATTNASRSILVVDDEALIRHNLADFFADEGFRVFEAEDADDASGIMAAKPSIRVVLTAVNMPGSMDGVKLAHSPTRELRATHTRPFLLHGSIGPSCAVALARDGVLTVWTHRQGVSPLRTAIAGLVGLPVRDGQVGRRSAWLTSISRQRRLHAGAWSYCFTARTFAPRRGATRRERWLREATG